MLEKTNPNFQLVCTMTEMSKSKKEWKGETRLMNQEILSRHLINPQEPSYYIAGPPAMVAGLRKMLVAANVDEDDIRTEDFAGH
jgi:Na+-transporting NADH:ubiquinone oxidoreductase subunit NqrF